ncbi:MAG TPA: hypothetical protein VNT79_12595 [Phycisphaerae bacterium]|nr:hypothetical protein [Phycisphaerae bacterium]
MMFMQRSESKKVILAVVLFALAGGLYFFLSSGESSGGGAETRSEWYCTACKKPFSTTFAQSQDLVRTQERAIENGADQSKNVPRMRGRGPSRMFTVAKCPECGQWTGEAARKCPDCGEVFPSKTKLGAPAICPKCHWDSHTGRKAEGDRLTEGLDPTP